MYIFAKIDKQLLSAIQVTITVTGFWKTFHANNYPNQSVQPAAIYVSVMIPTLFLM